MRCIPADPVGREVKCPTCKVSPGAGCVTTRAYRGAVGARIHGVHPARVRVSRARHSAGATT